MKKKNFSKKLNLNKTVVSNLSPLSMLKIYGGSENLETQETTDCDNKNTKTWPSGVEPQAASTLIMGGGKTI